MINITVIFLRNSDKFKLLFVLTKTSKACDWSHFELKIKVKHQVVGRWKHRTTFSFRNVPSCCFETPNYRKKKIFLVFQIILITFDVFVLKSVNKTWTSRAVFRMCYKFIFVSENHVAVVTLKSLFSFCILTFFVIMRYKCRPWINRKIIVIVMF